MFSTRSSCSCLSSSSCSPNPPLTPSQPLTFTAPTTKVHRSSLSHSPFYPCLPISNHDKPALFRRSCHSNAARSGKVLTGSGAPRDWGRLPAPAAPIPSIPLLVQTLLLLCVRHHCMVCAWTKQAAQRTTPLKPLSRENLPLLLLTTLRQPQQLMYTFAAVHS